MPQNPFETTPALGPTNKQAQLRTGALGELKTGAQVPANFEAASAGQAFMGANQALVQTSAALATTYVGICLSNPAASGKNLVLLSLGFELEVAPAALTSFGLIAGYSAAGVVTHTAALAPLNAFLNGAAAVAKLDSACTIVGTPSWVDWLSVTPATTSVVTGQKKYDGSIVIPPGGYVAIGTGIAGNAASFRGAFAWLELPQ